MNARVLCRLGRGPHDPRRLGHDLELSESTLRATLARLLELQLVRVARESSSSTGNGTTASEIELTPAGHGLAVVKFVAARFEWLTLNDPDPPSEHTA
ncbi:MAG: hypothetical protein H0X28_05030 [Solirubrobacterales bacterium]|nr:hypothetical protein [Solirubrobacterales bacterium]